jgi:RNA polymerase sigma-70 factor (ECF subfamily)
LVDYSTLADQSLIRLIARAQPDALAALYDRYSRLIFSLAFNIVGDQATAEEVTLDVFSRVWEKADTYQASQAKVTTWLTSIVRHRSIDHVRRQYSRPEKDSVSWVELTPGALLDGHNPETVTELSLQRSRILAAVAQLPADQQQALALAYFKGYSHRQIAEELGQPLGTIKTRIRLAMQKLRQLLPDDQLE